MHPACGVEREYLARVRGTLSNEQMLGATQTGVELEDGIASFERISAADLPHEGVNRWYRVVIREGRNREVRRLFAALGCEVSRLKRIRYGNIRLTRDIKLGRHQKVAPLQLAKLMQIAGLETSAPVRASRRPARGASKPHKSIKTARSTKSRSKSRQRRND